MTIWGERPRDSERRRRNEKVQALLAILGVIGQTMGQQRNMQWQADQKKADRDFKREENEKNRQNNWNIANIYGNRGGGSTPTIAEVKAFGADSDEVRAIEAKRQEALKAAGGDIIQQFQINEAFDRMVEQESIRRGSIKLKPGLHGSPAPMRDQQGKQQLQQVDQMDPQGQPLPQGAPANARIGGRPTAGSPTVGPNDMRAQGEYSKTREALMWLLDSEMGKQQGLNLPPQQSPYQMRFQPR